MTSGARFSLWANVLSDGREHPNSRVEIADGKIVNIEPSPRPQPGDQSIEDGWLAPGLIDLQLNGAGGIDLTCAADRKTAITSVARTLAQHGVTAFCPTIVSSPPELILNALTAYPPRAIGAGAEALGLHVEGPFIDPEHRGVHDQSFLREPSRAELHQWLQTSKPALVTLAPELPRALDAIHYLTRNGVVVSLGHSGADPGCVEAGIAEGASMATHLFNGMPPLHHRAPGLVGAVLASQIRFGLIADGVHVDPLMIDLVVRVSGVERVCLVSDALASAGVPPGEYTLGEQRIVSDGVSVRRADGTLAGSALLLDGCLRNVWRWLGASLGVAKTVQMATRTPASVLGLRHKGRIAAGYDADLIVLDEGFNITRTWVRGACVLA